MDLSVVKTQTAYRSLTGSQWHWREANERMQAALMQQRGLPEMLARVLSARGFDCDNVQDFLTPSLKSSLPDPAHLLDMGRAGERLAGAITAGETVAIFGDYDVDGATSSALLVHFLRALGCEPLVHIPDRIKEGYGPNIPALLSLKQRGASLVITVDCGTLSFEPLAAAHEAGLDVIVVDHHQGEARKPACYALVNPNRLDESSPHRQLAAVGVAFLLCVQTNRMLRAAGWFANRPEPDLRQWLDLVALGTVCDVVPLTGLNRAFVTQGLKVLAGRGNVGLNALRDGAGVDEKPSAYQLGFVLGPRINAGGRVGKSDLGVALLTAASPEEAQPMARELERYNQERRALETLALEEAMALAEQADPASPMLLIAGRWHPGIIGIIASRLKERFHVPSMVIALDGGIGKASGRSVSGFDMGAAIIAAREAGLLLAGGGHAMAAGFTVEESQIEPLRAFLLERLARQPELVLRQKQLWLDAALSVAGATPELVMALDAMAPFGQSNPHVRVVIENAVNLRPEIVGEHHVKTLLIDGLSNARLSAIAFRCVGSRLAQALLETRGQALHVAGQLKLQEWNGKISVSLVVDDVAAVA